MSEKVKLPKAVCDALDYAKEIMHTYDYRIVSKIVNEGFVTEEVKILNKQKPSEIMRALVLGYEPKVTPEEQIKKIWDQNELVCDFSNGIREGIKQTLLIHGIKYDWLNGDLK